MNAPLKLSLGAVALASVVAFTLHGESTASRSSFGASIHGAVSANPAGEAEFGMVQGEYGAAPVFTLSLGARSGNGAVLLTRVGGSTLAPGVYPVSERGDLRALVMTGTVSQPTGVFRAETGVLTITRSTDRSLIGEFRLEADGFLASDPTREDQHISVAGTFTAVPSTTK